MNNQKKNLYFWAIIPGVGTCIVFYCFYNMYKTNNKNLLKLLIYFFAVLFVSGISMIIAEEIGWVPSFSMDTKIIIFNMFFGMFWGYICIYIVIYNYYKDTENIDFVKKELFSIKKQYKFIFIPIINIIAIFLMALNNMDKMKSLLTFIIFSLAVFVVSTIFSEVRFLFNSSNYIIISLMIYIISLIICFSWIICQKKVIMKKMFNGEIILEDNKIMIIACFKDETKEH